MLVLIQHSNSRMKVGYLCETFWGGCSIWLSLNSAVPTPKLSLAVPQRGGPLAKIPLAVPYEAQRPLARSLLAEPVLSPGGLPAHVNLLSLTPAACLSDTKFHVAGRYSTTRGQWAQVSRRLSFARKRLAIQLWIHTNHRSLGVCCVFIFPHFWWCPLRTFLCQKTFLFRWVSNIFPSPICHPGLFFVSWLSRCLQFLFVSVQPRVSHTTAAVLYTKWYDA